MITYKTINIDGMKFDMEIMMYDTTNYAIVTLENGITERILCGTTYQNH